MSRRRRAERRVVKPDPIYGSDILARFINRLMIQGKKNTARTIVYGALDRLAKRVKIQNPLEAFEQALQNAMPALEVKSRRIGGATYPVPIEIPAHRQVAIAMRWIINHARAKKGKAMVDKLSQELIDCVNNQGATIKKKDDTHRMAEANKAFAHYRW